MSEENSNRQKNWHDRIYKKLLIIPFLLLLFSIIYLGYFISANGDIIRKDVSLTGGTTITVFDETTNINDLKESLKPLFPDIDARTISDIRTGKQHAFFIETVSAPDEIRPVLENYLGYKLNTDNSSTEFTGSTISLGFYQQLRFAVILAFIFMAAVVFIIFRTPIPSMAVILSAFADIIMTIAVINILKINVSIGGIVALLMLIGYSVDTDVLLTTRVLRKKGQTINRRIFDAFKTGIMMTLTSVLAVFISLIIIYNFSDVLRQIFTILLIGLGFDIFNTWVTNVSILKWYAEVKHLE